MEHKVEITQLTTPDGLIHHGFVFDPPDGNGTAILFVHGLSGTFYGGLPMHRAFMDACAAAGYGYASFNTRGHDMIAGIRKVDAADPKGYTHTDGGAGFETFTQCGTDISAGIDFLSRRGYGRIVIAGHSTGANKACYFAACLPRDPRVTAVVLLSPISDRLSGSTPSVFVRWWLSLLVRMGRGDTLMHLPGIFFPLTPRRALSLITPKSDEDVFDYGDPEPTLQRFAAMKYPSLAVLGERDVLADRPVPDIARAFDTHAPAGIRYRTAVIAQADHQFTGHESEMVRRVMTFIGRGK